MIETGRYVVVNITTGTVHGSWLTFNHAALWANTNLHGYDWRVYVYNSVMGD